MFAPMIPAIRLWDVFTQIIMQHAMMPMPAPTAMYVQAELARELPLLATTITDAPMIPATHFQAAYL